MAWEWKKRRLSNIDEEIFRVKRCRILAEAEIASYVSSGLTVSKSTTCYAMPLSPSEAHLPPEQM